MGKKTEEIKETKERKSGCFSFEFLDEDDFKALADILKVPSIPDRQTEQITSALEDYAASKDEGLPRISTATQRIIALNKALKKAIPAFSDLTDCETQAIAVGGKDIKGILSLLETILPNLEIIQKGSKQALTALKQKRDGGGRPSDIALNMLITRLAAIYKTITKKQAAITWNAGGSRITGKFPDFVECCLTASGQEYDGYLRGHIRDILKKKKECDLSNLRRIPTINTEG